MRRQSAASTALLAKAKAACIQSPGPFLSDLNVSELGDLVELVSRFAQPNLVLIAMAHPVLRTFRVLVPALGCQIKKMVSGVQHVYPARVSGVGVEHRS